MVRGRPSNAALSKNQSLALARQIQLKARNAITPPSLNSNNTDNRDADSENSGDEIECTGWSGEVTHYVSSDEEPIFVSDDSEEEVEELSGSELEEVIQRRAERLAGVATTGQPAARTMVEEPPVMLEQPMTEPDMLSVIMGQRTNQEWKKAESTRSLGYNGQSTRTKRHQAKIMRDKEMGDAKLRKG